MCSDDQETRSARADMFLAFAILAKDRLNFSLVGGADDFLDRA